MKVVIDTNVIISAALGSQTCKEAILKALEKYEVIEPKIVSMELDRFYLKMSQEIKNNKKIKAILDINVSQAILFIFTYRNLLDYPNVLDYP